MNERRFLFWLAIPFAVLVVLLLFVLQGNPDGSPCSVCEGTGKVYPYFSDPLGSRGLDLIDCGGCGGFRWWRLNEFLRKMVKLLPETLMGSWACGSVIAFAVMIWSLWVVPCRCCEDRADKGCSACGGKGLYTRLDGWALSGD
jgi:hypothetical protein